MNPARSCDQTTCLPSTVPANCSACWRVSGAVSSDVTSSTRCITGTGLKKCMPMTDAGRAVAIASFMIGIDDVFDARIASGDSTTLSSIENTWTFSGSLSTTASTTSSRSARAA